MNGGMQNKQINKEGIDGWMDGWIKTSTQIK